MRKAWYCQVDQHIDKLSVCLTSVWLTIANLRRSLVFSPDSGTYLQWSDALLGHNFDVLAYLQGNDFVVAPYFYLLQVMLISGLRQTFGEGWPLCFHAINIVWVQVVLVAYWQTARLLHLHRLAIAVGCLTLALSADLLTWPHYMLTDSLYMALVMLGIWAATACLSTRTGYQQGLPVQQSFVVCYGYMIIVCVLLSLARPSSPPLMMILLLSPLALIVARWIDTFRKLAAMLILIVIAMALGYAGFVVHVLELDPSTRPASWNLIVNHLAEGGVIHDRPETYRSAPNGWGDIVALLLVRLAWFFSPLAADFSIKHQLITRDGSDSQNELSA
jgi:hypothetical protein